MGTLLVQGFILERGPKIFKLFLSIQFVKVLHSKMHWKTFHPFYHPPFSHLICPPIKNLKEALNMFTGMYCNIHLLESMRLSTFSPLSYPELEKMPLITFRSKFLADNESSIVLFISLNSLWYSAKVGVKSLPFFMNSSLWKQLFTVQGLFCLHVYDRVYNMYVLRPFTVFKWRQNMLLRYCCWNWEVP